MNNKEKKVDNDKQERERQLLIEYHHYDCPVNPNILWFDIWESAVDGVCPACGMENIVPVSWSEIHQDQ